MNIGNLYSGLLSGASFLAAEQRLINRPKPFRRHVVVDIMQQYGKNRVLGMIKLKDILSNPVRRSYMVGSSGVGKQGYDVN